MPAEPYLDTSVPVARSQAAIEKLLSEAGALGVRFNFGRFRKLQPDADADAEPQVVEFVWPVEGGEQVVRLTVTPKPPEPKPWSARSTGWKVTPEQRERQAWRGLYWYLEGTLKAATFGLIRFEDVFLSFIVSGPEEGAPTIGELMVSHLQHGGRATALLSAGDYDGDEEIVDAEVVS